MNDVSLVELWLPILLSAVFVFIASSVVHMALNWHKNDYGRLPDEDRALEALRSVGIPPGSYRFPYCESMSDMNSDATKQKYDLGPVGLMVLMPNGPFTMGRSLVQWFLYSIVISCFAAYVASMTLTTGVECELVFRVASTVAILGYATSNVSNSMWKGEGWLVTARFAIDGTVYGLITGATIGWLWPGA